MIVNPGGGKKTSAPTTLAVRWPISTTSNSVTITSTDLTFAKAFNDAMVRKKYMVDIVNCTAKGANAVNELWFASMGYINNSEVKVAGGYSTSNTLMLAYLVGHSLGGWEIDGNAAKFTINLGSLFCFPQGYQIDFVFRIT